MSGEQSEVPGEEALAKEEEAGPIMKKQLPEQRLPALENVTQLGELPGLTAAAEKAAEPTGPPQQEKKAAAKDEL